MNIINQLEYIFKNSIYCFCVCTCCDKKFKNKSICEIDCEDFKLTFEYIVSVVNGDNKLSYMETLKIGILL